MSLVKTTAAERARAEAAFIMRQDRELIEMLYDRIEELEAQVEHLQSLPAPLPGVPPPIRLPVLPGRPHWFSEKPEVVDHGWKHYGVWPRR